jgi:hypothetical protein
MRRNAMSRKHQTDAMAAMHETAPNLQILARAKMVIAWKNAWGPFDVAHKGADKKIF